MLVSDQIIQVLDDLCLKLGLAIDWASENVAPYLTMLCTKLVSYEIWTSVAWMAFSVIALTIVFSLTVKFRSGIGKAVQEDLLGMLIIIGYLMVCTACIIGIIFESMDIIKCLTFPELFVFEYIKVLTEAA